MATKKAVKGGLVKWDAKLAELAQLGSETVESIGTGGQIISLKSGRMSYNGNPVPGNKMTVVVVDHILENAYYVGDYDPDNPKPPVCFAFGRKASEMAPHADSTEPQHETCKGCPQNEWGSAEKGKGKACKNIVRLGLLAEGDVEDADSINNSEHALMKVPVTSTKNWAGYVNQITSVLHKPTLAVLTEITVVPDDKSQFKINFENVGEIEDAEQLEALIQKHEVVKAVIDTPYQPVEEDEKPRGRNTKAGAARGRKVVQAPARKQKFAR